MTNLALIALRKYDIICIMVTFTNKASISHALFRPNYNTITLNQILASNQKDIDMQILLHFLLKTTKMHLTKWISLCISVNKLTSNCLSCLLVH